MRCRRGYHRCDGLAKHWASGSGRGWSTLEIIEIICAQKDVQCCAYSENIDGIPSRETLAAGVGRGLLNVAGAAAGTSSPKPPSRSTSWTGAAAGFAGAAGADVDAIRALGAREFVAAVRLDVEADRDGPSS